MKSSLTKFSAQSFQGRPAPYGPVKVGGADYDFQPHKKFLNLTLNEDNTALPQEPRAFGHDLISQGTEGRTHEQCLSSLAASAPQKLQPYDAPDKASPEYHRTKDYHRMCGAFLENQGPEPMAAALCAHTTEGSPFHAKSLKTYNRLNMHAQMYHHYLLAANPDMDNLKDHHEAEFEILSRTKRTKEMFDKLRASPSCFVEDHGRLEKATMPTAPPNPEA